MTKNFLFSISFIMFAITANAGTEIQNGGNSTISEFKGLASEVVYSFLNNDSILVPTNSKKLLQIISDAKIECGSNLVLKNEPKDAINFPYGIPQKILLDCEKWSKSLSTSVKYRLAIHEFLALAFIDDSTYSHSQMIVSKFFIERQSSSILSINLLINATECDLSSFEENVTMGANIFYMNQVGATVFSQSLLSACLPIVNELISLGARPVLNDSFLGSASYLIFTDEYNHEQKITLFNKLVKISPALVEELQVLPFTTFRDHLPYSYWNIERVKYMEKCGKNSTLMHILAQVKNYHLINYFIDLGFSFETKNICGDSPRDIIYR